MGPGGRVSCAFWSLAGSVGLCISLALVPVSCFSLLSPSLPLTLFLGFPLLCVAPCTPDSLAVPVFSLTVSSRSSCNPLGRERARARCLEGGRCASYWMEQAQGEQAAVLG